MAFRVGQKVVCIGWDWDDVSDHETLYVNFGPDKGDIATVSAVISKRDFTHLELVEFPTPDDDAAPGWSARAFRPLTERKNDGQAFVEKLKDICAPEKLKEIA